MKRVLIAIVVLGFAGAPAFAEDVTEDQKKLIEQAIADFGCEGGKFTRETGGMGVLQAADVKCKSGQYDFRLLKDGKVFAITMD